MNNSSDRKQRLTDTEFFQKIIEIENPKYYLDYTHEFKKSVRASYKSGKDLSLLLVVVTKLAQQGQIEDEYLPHPLKGFPKITGKVMECHIMPDWLLVWIQEDDKFTLLLFDTGSHSKLFDSNKLRKGKIK